MELPLRTILSFTYLLNYGNIFKDTFSKERTHVG